jgi:hypothetical protein
MYPPNFLIFHVVHVIPKGISSSQNFLFITPVISHVICNWGLGWNKKLQRKVASAIIHILSADTRTVTLDLCSVLFHVSGRNNINFV